MLSVQLPLLARNEGVQFLWTQASGFHANEEVWQLDDVVVLYINEINSPLLSTFSGIEQSSSVMYYSGGSIEVCNSINFMLLYVASYIILSRLQGNQTHK